ncbi:hypothetical protein IGI04_035825 [Brassica rapa subsp. trilocularis]|uniref:DUF1985 domain-containing protein n=1 Tax=Brassica rapa subsp. trilocularis TaxID=1813537 RepID=A0ABQ7LFH1_BRACM|nr:hypothetical protein IGI04_035825 [Brassica rapa subsp. trilocularis]
MDLLELAKRIFTLEEKSFPFKSIAYHTNDFKLLSAVRAALHDDEYEELKDSRLGVFIEFKELNFGWSLHMLCFQLNIKKKFELWSLVGPELVKLTLIEFEYLTGLNCNYIENLENQKGEFIKEMVSFWETMGVVVDAGPSSELIISTWKKYSSTTRATLARLVMDLEEFENYSWGEIGVDLLCAARLGYYLWRTHTKQTDSTFSGLQRRLLGRLIVKSFESHLTRMINYVQKDFGEMFSNWNNDAEDTATENISPVKEETVVKEESGRAQKKSRKEASTVVSGVNKAEIEQCFKDLAEAMRDGFGMCLQEIKLLGDWMKAV